MRQLTTALKSSKIASLLALTALIGYAATEFGDHQSNLAEAKLPRSEDSKSFGELVDDQKLALSSVPTPLSRPTDLPEVEQPYQLTVVSLSNSLNSHSFDLASIRNGNEVPRVFVEAMPADIQDVERVQKRKQVFLSVTLPLILKVNEEISADRKRLLEIIAQINNGHRLNDSDQKWLQRVAKRYQGSTSNLYDLLIKVDTIPVSLALAQSIEESGWGTSRFARLGNALFGQRVWSKGKGIVPQEREEGATYEVQAFDHLEQSIRSYAINLNRHTAYEDLRTRRAHLKSLGIQPTGHDLAETLSSYSERGAEYVDTLKALIDANQLTDFDTAELSPERFAQILSSASN